MRFPFGTLLALAVTTTTASAQFARVRVRPPGFAEQVALDTLMQPLEFNAPYGKLYSATLAVFDDLKIPMTTKDSLKGVVGNLELKKTGSLAGSQMSRWMNCGAGMTGPNADNFRIWLSVAVMLNQTKGQTSTHIRAGLVSGAEDMQGHSMAPIGCASTGALEQILLEKIKQKAGAM
jgi:hypothetical protein